MELKNLEQIAIEEISKVQTEHELNEKKAMFLGKKSKLQEIMATMKDLSSEDRKKLGQLANEFKTKIELLVANKRKELEQLQVLKQLENETLDVTLDGKVINSGGFHP